jgi:hypothetical protein
MEIAKYRRKNWGICGENNRFSLRIFDSFCGKYRLKSPQKQRK